MGEPNGKIRIVRESIEGLEQRIANRVILRKLHQAETSERRRNGNLREYNHYTTLTRPRKLSDLRSEKRP